MLPRPDERPEPLRHHPALDGLRGLALAAIIIYHAGPDTMPGAFLSVSTFFTLSGFLIARGLLHEHAGTGRISLGDFWARRLRRLMPAALVAVTTIVVASVWLADDTQWLRLRSDALAAVAYVANWRFIAAGDAYEATFASPSPFTHFWTLAIEEQFYILLPVLVVAGLALTRGSRRAIALGAGTLMVASIAWANWLVSSGSSVDRRYFGTDVRLPELLAGVVLAAVTAAATSGPADAGRAPAWQRPLRVVAPLVLAAVAVSWTTADLHSAVFYRGALTAYSALTCLLILAAHDLANPVTQLLAWRPLVWVGTVSYGAYLAHYPILLWLRLHTEWGTITRVAVAVPATFAVAALSSRFVERPIRRATGWGTARTVATSAAAVGVAVALIVGVVAVAPERSTTDLAEAARWQQYLEETAAQDASDAPRIAFYGDSTAVMTGRGMSEVSRRRPDDFVVVGGFADLGCGLNGTGTRRVQGKVVEPPEVCRDWLARWREAAAEQPADVAVVQLGPWEVADQRLGADGPFLTIGQDPELDAELTALLTAGIDELLLHHGVVVVVRPPDIELGRNSGRSPDSAAPDSDPARMARFREIVDTVTAGRERVATVDLDAWVRERGDDRELRPDGVHFTDGSAQTVAEWLGPRLVDTFEALTGGRTTRVARR